MDLKKYLMHQKEQYKLLNNNKSSNFQSNNHNPTDMLNRSERINKSFNSNHISNNEVYQEIPFVSEKNIINQLEKTNKQLHKELDDYQTYLSNRINDDTKKETLTRRPPVKLSYGRIHEFKHIISPDQLKKYELEKIKKDEYREFLISQMNEKKLQKSIEKKQKKLEELEYEKQFQDSTQYEKIKKDRGHMVKQNKKLQKPIVMEVSDQMPVQEEVLITEENTNQLSGRKLEGKSRLVYFQLDESDIKKSQNLELTNKKDFIQNSQNNNELNEKFQYNQPQQQIFNPIQQIPFYFPPQFQYPQINNENKEKNDELLYQFIAERNKLLIEYKGYVDKLIDQKESARIEYEKSKLDLEANEEFTNNHLKKLTKLEELSKNPKNLEQIYNLKIQKSNKDYNDQLNSFAKPIDLNYASTRNYNLNSHISTFNHSFSKKPIVNNYSYKNDLNHLQNKSDFKAEEQVTSFTVNPTKKKESYKIFEETSYSQVFPQNEKNNNLLKILNNKEKENKENETSTLKNFKNSNLKDDVKILYNFSSDQNLKPSPLTFELNEYKQPKKTSFIENSNLKIISDIKQSDPINHDNIKIETNYTKKINNQMLDRNDVISTKYDNINDKWNKKIKDKLPSNNMNKNNSESLLNVNVNKNNKVDLFLDKKVDLLNLGESNDNYNNYENFVFNTNNNKITADENPNLYYNKPLNLLYPVTNHENKPKINPRFKVKNERFEAEDILKDYDDNNIIREFDIINKALDYG